MFLPGTHKDFLMHALTSSDLLPIFNEGKLQSMCAKIVHANATICKQELLKVWDKSSKMGVPAFVVESVQPFSGIDPAEGDPRHAVYLYLVFGKVYSEQELAIATEGLESRFRLVNDIASGTLEAEGAQFSVIRLKDTDDPVTLDSIAYMLRNKGIDMRTMGPTEPFSGRLAINKFLYLEEVCMGCYLDRVEKTKGYILLDEKPADDQIVKWEQMDSLEGNLDLATGVLSHGGTDVPMVRIYSKQMDAEVLLLIKKALSL
jgi:hypothetical protein